MTKMKFSVVPLVFDKIPGECFDLGIGWGVPSKSSTPKKSQSLVEAFYGVLKGAEVVFKERQGA